LYLHPSGQIPACEWNFSDVNPPVHAWATMYLYVYEVAEDISRRLTSIFTRDASSARPVYGGTAKFQNDPHWRDYVLFYEYFHGDNGTGLGARLDRRGCSLNSVAGLHDG
jgi:hypothetical protein